MRRLPSSATVLVTAIVVGSAFSAVAQAAPGDLDPIFSSDGKLTQNLGTTHHHGDDFALGIARQSDGKIVAAGYSDQDFALARYNANSTLDTSFSGDGKTTTDFGGADFGHAIALQPDNKIIVAGRVANDWGLARYNPNGTLDTSFSGDGKVTTDFGGADSVFSVAIQSDGKILAGGSSKEDANTDFALARYNPNGALDTSFSGDGKKTTDFGGGRDAVFGVAIQANGRIVAAGVAELSGGSDFALARYNPTGALDTSFSGDGKVTTGFGRGAEANAVAIQPDGKIVAAGDNPFGGSDFALARYRSGGTLDTSFSGDGKVTTDLGGSDVINNNAIAIQPDDKIVAVGESNVGGNFNFALARYNPSGALDTSFSGDGKKTTDSGPFDGLSGVVIQPDRTIIVAGGTDSDFALARYRPGGNLDTSFAPGGLRKTDFLSLIPSKDYGNAVAIQSDGKIVVAGNSDKGGEEREFQFSLTRFNPDGTLDTSFGAGGSVITYFSSGSEAKAVAIQPDGKIVVAGSSDRDFALARYNANGTLDTSFSGDGKLTTGLGHAANAAGVVIQPDGKLVAAGQSVVGANEAEDHDVFALARYNANGTLDTSFSGDGKVATDLAMDSQPDVIRAVAIQSNDRIVAAGWTSSLETGTRFALARYKANGTLDTSFSGDGVQRTRFDSPPYFNSGDAANAVAIQPDGKIVAAGYHAFQVGGGGSSNFALARYNPSGTLDTSFSGDGKKTSRCAQDTDDHSNEASGVAIQSDGRIVAAGTCNVFGNGDSNFALARYNAGGALDTSFSGDGKVRTDLGGFEDPPAVAIQANGKIVLAGSSEGSSVFPPSKLALARYLGG